MAVDDVGAMVRGIVDGAVEQATDFTVEWPHNFHIGFELPTAADVHALHGRFKTDGVELRTAVVRARRGTRFFCVAPGGLLVEVNIRADADAAV